MEVNILGTKYDFSVDDLNNPDLAQNDGICKIYDKGIVIRNPAYMPGETEETRERRYEHVLRHEIIHAFAEESGVSYGDNEDLVDWIAAMIPRINAVYEEIQKNELSPANK